MLCVENDKTKSNPFNDIIPKHMNYTFKHDSRITYVGFRISSYKRPTDRIFSIALFLLHRYHANHASNYVAFEREGEREKKNDIVI